MADFVYVGCKSPNGYVLNLERYEAVDSDRGIVRRVGQDRGCVVLKGNAHKEGVPDLSINGYVFTRVDKAWWEEWRSTHADSPLLADGYIMVANSEAATKPMAKERGDQRGQFSRLTEKDPRTSSMGTKKYIQEDMAA